MEVIDSSDKKQTATAPSADGSTNKPEAEKLFSNENLTKDSVVENPEPQKEPTIKIGAETPTVTITPEDKVAFLDAIINNTRFTKSYSLFGGRIKIKIRSLTMDETNALAAWAFKQAVKDTTWHISGRGRRYVLAAQVAMYNGTELPPLEAPLYETLDKDGKTTIDPGWVSRDSFWEDKDSGVIDAVIRCLSDFDMRYHILASKAEDENFWNPDTP